MSGDTGMPPPARRSRFFRNAAAFPRDGHLRFAIDRVSVTCYLKPPWYKLPLRLTDEADEELNRAKAIKHREGRKVAMVGPKLTVVIGGVRSRSGLFVDNVMRRLRRRLIEDGRYPAGIKTPGARDDNFVDPAHLAAGVDLHAESISELMSIIENARAAYAMAVAKLFGVATSPEDVQASVTQIELNWDVRSDLAQALSTLWWRAWRDACVGASIGVGQQREHDERLRARRTEATEHREADAMIGSGVLRADAAVGGGYKLYAKHDRLVRFEAELTAGRVEKLLGRRLRVDSAEHLRADLETLGQRAYGTILRAQDNLVCEQVMSITELIAAFAPPGDASKLRPLLEALEAGLKFHHAGRTHERLLPRLRDQGLVQHLGRGIWAPTPMLSRTFGLAQYLRTRSEGPA